MKIILTGNTGFIGREVLTQCIANPAMTSIITLSRRELPISDPKLTKITHQDFTSYPPSLLQQLDGADACIWSLGIAMPKTPEEGQRVNMDYTLAAAKAFATLSTSDGKPFRFVYLSGRYTEKNQDKSLWFLTDARKMRGRIEIALLAMPEFSKGSGYEIFIARPGFVRGKDTRLMGLVLRVFSSIPVDGLALALVDVGTRGSDQRVWEMEHLMKRGQSLAA